MVTLGEYCWMKSFEVTIETSPGTLLISMPPPSLEGSGVAETTTSGSATIPPAAV